jgi:hypothetical protein
MLYAEFAESTGDAESRDNAMAMKRHGFGCQQWLCHKNPAKATISQWWKTA